MLRSRSWFKFIMAEMHLWLGISSGIVVFILCLTGSIYAFKPQIEDFLHREYVYLQEDRTKIDPDKVVKQLTQSGHYPTRIVIPEDPGRALVVSTAEPETEIRHTLYVNADGSVRGEKSRSSSGFFSWMFRMHRWLLMESQVGRTITGAATLMFLLIVISGFILWIPKKLRSLRQRLIIPLNSGWKRVNYDLHSVLGFYAMFLLFVMGATGLSWSYEWYDTLVYKTLDGEVPDGKRIRYVSDTTQMGSTASLISILSDVQGRLNYPGDISIRLPAKPEATIYVSRTHMDGFAMRYTDYIQYDQYSGEVLTTRLYSERSTAGKFFGILKALHMGYIFGDLSLILYFVACMIGTSLPVTGVIIWINKLKKRKRKKPVIVRTEHRRSTRNDIKVSAPQRRRETAKELV